MNHNTISLDQYLEENGSIKTKYYFSQLILRNKWLAIHLINQIALDFSTLYYIIPLIKQSNLYDYLNPRNKFAITVYEDILYNKNTNPDLDLIKEQNMPLYLNVLRWMLSSSLNNTISDCDYDKTMDVIATILIKEHNDTTILITLVDLIFIRCRNGSFYHDLIWILFQSNDTTVLELISNHLNSNDNREKKLAFDLLTHDYPRIRNKQLDSANLYNTFHAFIDENKNYITFTGESFNLSSNPTFFNVNLDSKYLCKKIDRSSTIHHLPFTINELKQLKDFHKLDREKQIQLADFSNSMYKDNLTSWNQWVKEPVIQQTYALHNSYGGNI